MKKQLTITLIIMQLFFCSLASAVEVKTVRVGVYDNNPKIYMDSDGKIKGFWADITNYIAQKEG
jgi:two-component system, cell cycle sensor histidine kinase and response regulator CckA